MKVTSVLRVRTTFVAAIVTAKMFSAKSALIRKVCLRAKREEKSYVNEG